MISRKTKKEVWAMVYDCGMTIKEIAEIRGIKRDSVIDYLRRYERDIEDGIIDDILAEESKMIADMLEEEAKVEEKVREEMNKSVVEYDFEETDADIIAENVRLAKQKQKLQDTNRIERKSFREQARMENALEELNIALIDILKDNQFNSFVPTTTIGEYANENGVEASRVGVIQFSDGHLNELVNLPNNKYDIMVANRRVRKHVNKCIAKFLNSDVEAVVIVFTGDMINSDRRLDEKLSMATNRMRAMFLAVEIFKQAIEEVNHLFPTFVASVSGNESRINEEYGWSNLIMSDNYDYAIHNVLAKLFENSDVTFIGDCEVEKVVNVGGSNILLLHGNQVKTPVGRSIASIKSRYADTGTNVDYVLFGHIHEALIADMYARSASLVGANAYSENGLQLSSRASQNGFIIGDGEIEGFRNDLQDISCSIGYDIHQSLEAYNPKSADKVTPKREVFSVVI